jgi:hypothetical protein
MSDDRRHLDRKIAYHLGQMLDRMGRIEGRCLALLSDTDREFGVEYYSKEFREGLTLSFAEIREEVDHCFDALAADAGDLIDPAPIDNHMDPHG